MKAIKIEMIHDLVCSWCPIGYRHLMTAVKRLEGKVDVDIHFLPFQLNPDMPAQGQLIADYFQQRMGWDAKKLAEYQASLIETGKAANVIYDFSKRTHYYNTHKGHCLIHWAEKFGQHQALNELMITAYFTQGKNLNDENVLSELVEELGLEPNEALKALRDPSLEKELNDKKKRVDALNITSIPAFLINGKHLVTCSNSADFFEDTLIKFSANVTQATM